MMNSFEPQIQESLRRRWQDAKPQTSSTHTTASDPQIFPNITENPKASSNALGRFPTGLGFDDDLVTAEVVPPVTVVLEGRSICQRISLHKHGSYKSLAKALRQMFVDCEELSSETDDLDLSNAIPGHLIAYEDMENDLLLAGDLSWKDFVRVARRIRVLPAKGKSRRGRGDK